ncbi:MAG: hypothetical protein HY720_30520 [Planctomycetes bacterium]|nr:hypothetical protein [Planctomycetota bacterium]
MNRLRAFLAGAGDRVNPLLVREVQRTFKSRIFIFGFVLALVAFLLAGVFAVEQKHVEADRPQGTQVFAILFSLYNLAAWLAVPIYGFRWIFEEKRDDTYPILSITTIGPWRLVTGRLSAGLAQLVMVLAAAAPFITYAYLLRGLDIVMIAAFLGSSTAISVLLLLFGIFLSSLPSTRGAFAGLAVIFGLGLLFLVGTGFGWTTVWFAYGGGGRIDLAELGAVLVAVLPLYGVLAVSARATLAPATTNYALPIRLSVVATIAIWFLGGFALVEANDLDDFSVLWSVASIGLLAFAGIGAIGEPEDLSRRIRVQLRGARSWGVRRLLVPTLITGKGTGFAFILISLGAVCAGHWLLLGVDRGHASAGEWLVPPILALYVAIYLGMSLVIVRRLLPARFRTPRTYRFLPFLLAGGLSIVSALPYLVLARRGSRGLLPSDYLSPLSLLAKFDYVRSTGSGLVAGVILLVAAAVAVSVNADLIGKGFRQVVRAKRGLGA